jgi:hypothetical protein
MSLYFLLVFVIFLSQISINNGFSEFLSGWILVLLSFVQPVILTFTLFKIQKLLKTDLPERKTFLNPFIKFRELKHFFFILIIVWFGYRAFDYFYTYYQLSTREDYGTPVTANSPQIISESHISPDKVYAVKEIPRPAVQQIGFSLYDKNGNYLKTIT